MNALDYLHEYHNRTNREGTHMLFENFVPVSPYRIRMFTMVDGKDQTKTVHTVIGFARNPDTAAPEMVIMDPYSGPVSLSDVEMENEDSVREDYDRKVRVSSRVEIVNELNGLQFIESRFGAQAAKRR